MHIASSALRLLWEKNTFLNGQKVCKIIWKNSSVALAPHSPGSGSPSPAHSTVPQLVNWSYKGSVWVKDQSCFLLSWVSSLAGISGHLKLAGTSCQPAAEQSPAATSTEKPRRRKVIISGTLNKTSNANFCIEPRALFHKVSPLCMVDAWNLRSAYRSWKAESTVLRLKLWFQRV